LAVTSRWTTTLPTRPVAPITVMVKKDPPKHLGPGFGSPSVSEEGVVPHNPRERYDGIIRRHIRATSRP
jgi:hypothetical protein